MATYEDTINSLKSMLTRIAQEIKDKSLSATKLKPTDFAVEINKLNNVIYLGEGTSFDIKAKYPALYSKLTVDNFIVESTTASASGQSGGTVGKSGGGFARPRCSYSATTTLAKQYNATTGALTCSVNVGVSGSIGGCEGDEFNNGGNGSGKCKVYLIIGNIKK